MPKVTKSELAKFQGRLRSKTHEELRIVLPKDLLADIRKVSKATNTPVVTLFEEMAVAIAAGTLPKSKSK